MIKYKDTHAAKGSGLYEALKSADKKLTEKMYKATTEACIKLYGAENYKAFVHMQKEFNV